MKKIKASSRLRFPEDEKRFTWLPLLLNAYATIDKGVAAAVKREERDRKVSLACVKGCSSCCATHRDIPLYPLEIMGIFWYVVEKIVEPLRSVLRDRLSEHTAEKPCPFLVDRACSIHPLRPMACRQFNVFSRPCAEGEDPYYTRRDDVLSPLQDFTDQAFSIMLPFHGITDSRAQAEFIRNRFMHTIVRVLQECNWRELPRKMDEHDKRQPSAP